MFTKIAFVAAIAAVAVATAHGASQSFRCEQRVVLTPRAGTRRVRLPATTQRARRAKTVAALSRIGAARPRTDSQPRPRAARAIGTPRAGM